MAKEYFYKLECETDPANGVMRSKFVDVIMKHLKAIKRIVFKKYFYRIETEYNPVTAYWPRGRFGYKFVKNEGIYSREPITDMFNMFRKTYLTELDIRDWDLSEVTDMSYMCNNCHNLTSVSLPDTSNVTDMRGMFLANTKLTSVTISDTSNVNTMCSMFMGATSLESVSLSNTSNVTDMHGMFCGAIRLKSVTIPDTSNVTNMKCMFMGATDFTQDIRDWDVSRVTDFTNMFRGATAMQEKFGVGDTPTREWFNKEAKGG